MEATATKIELAASIEQVKGILDSIFLGSKFAYNVSESKTFDGKPMLKIWAAASDHEINNVRGQMVQLVSLALWPNELAPQVFGGSGGQRIYRKPNIEIREEKYLAMKGEKVPFKRPKNEPKAILSAIERFFKNYVATLRTHKDVLMYQDIVNYDELLESVPNF